MNQTVLVVKNAFDISWCNACFDAVKNLQVAALGGGITKTSVRKSSVSFISGTLSHPKLFIPLIQFISDANENHYKWDLTEPECIQFTEYNEINQGMYNPHEDMFPYTPEAQTNRKLSISVQLSDGSAYEGGDLVFPDIEEALPTDMMKGIGTAIIFPSYLKHGVTPVTKGVRHSAVSWMLGPTFR